MPISDNPSPTTTTKRAWIVQSFLLGAAIAAAAGAHAFSRFRNSRSRVVGIIPARYKSSRFEGKPLVHILGKPMIQRTWERTKLASTLDHVVVATDDEKIAECCSGFGADVIMTPESCRNGTERCYEALKKLTKKYDVVINIQGDEPLIEPEIIDGVVKALQICRICLAGYLDNEELHELPCTNLFHTECVDKWLAINALCSLCKSDVGNATAPSALSLIALDGVPPITGGWAIVARMVEFEFNTFGMVSL